MFRWEDCYNELTEEEIRSIYDDYCNWCWGSGFGDCDVCKEAFNKKMEGL